MQGAVSGIAKILIFAKALVYMHYTMTSGL